MTTTLLEEQQSHHVQRDTMNELNELARRILYFKLYLSESARMVTKIKEAIKSFRGAPTVDLCASRYNAEAPHFYQKDWSILTDALEV